MLSSKLIPTVTDPTGTLATWKKRTWHCPTRGVVTLSVNSLTSSNLCLVSDSFVFLSVVYLNYLYYVRNRGQLNNNSNVRNIYCQILIWLFYSNLWTKTQISENNYIRKNRALQCRLKNVNKYFQIFVLVKKYIRRIFIRRKVNISPFSLLWSSGLFSKYYHCEISSVIFHKDKLYRCWLWIKTTHTEPLKHYWGGMILYPFFTPCSLTSYYTLKSSSTLPFSVAIPIVLYWWARISY